MTSVHNAHDGADLYYEFSRRGWGQLLNFRRFESLGAAVKYAVEELGPGRPYMSIEMGDVALDRRQILTLYDELDFPLALEFREKKPPAERGVGSML
jgi:hypothetical protein